VVVETSDGLMGREILAADRYRLCIAGKAPGSGADGSADLLGTAGARLAGARRVLVVAQDRQYDDLEGAAWRAVMDDDAPAEGERASGG
jgi:hypothetical protein